MKRLMVTSIVLLAGISAEAMAVDCTNATQLKNSDVATAVSGKTVCAANGGNKWQEYHATNFDLIDYKKGPSDPVDKTAKVGTWSTSGTGNGSVVTYNYGSGGTYSYEIHLNGTQYSLCGVTNSLQLNVTLLPVQGACP